MSARVARSDALARAPQLRITAGVAAVRARLAAWCMAVVALFTASACDSWHAGSVRAIVARDRVDCMNAFRLEGAMTRWSTAGPPLSRMYQFPDARGGSLSLECRGAECTVAWVWMNYEPRPEDVRQALQHVSSLLGAYERVCGVARASWTCAATDNDPPVCP